MESAGEVIWLLDALKHHPSLFVVVVIALLLGIIAVVVVPKIFPKLIDFWTSKVVHKDSVKNPVLFKEEGDYDKLLSRLDKIEVLYGDVAKTMQAAKDEMVKQFKDQYTIIHSMSLPVNAAIMYNAEVSLYDRLRAGYEYFLLEGNHGAEKYFVSKVIMSNVEGKKEWWSLKAAMAREGRIPTTEYSKKIFQAIEDAIG